MPSSGTHDWIGQTLAERYHVTEKLGAGGMGTVFKASDTRLDAEVVIKAPHPVMIKDAEFAIRFTREIQSLVRLDHPHIVNVMDVGEHDGLPFAVMQYLSGGSLEDRPRPCAPKDVAAWLPNVAEALDFMHDEGLIHRDIKPGNILFDSTGRAYLGDFGIAKMMAEGEESEEKLTGTGAMIGTAEYMAPEMLIPAAFKEAYNQRADQYSLAVTVYEMLAGRPPFRGNSMGDVIAQLATKNAKALHKRNSAIPEDVSRVVSGALQKKPQKRFESCQEFARSFVAAVGGESPSAVVQQPSQQQEADVPAVGHGELWPENAKRKERPDSPVVRHPTVKESPSTPSRLQTQVETQPDRGETVHETPRDRSEQSPLAGLEGFLTRDTDSPPKDVDRARKREKVANRENRPLVIPELDELDLFSADDFQPERSTQRYKRKQADLPDKVQERDDTSAGFYGLSFKTWAIFYVIFTLLVWLYLYLMDL